MSGRSAPLLSVALANPGRAAFIVDEAVTVTEEELGARTPVRRGRTGRNVDPNSAAALNKRVGAKAALDTDGSSATR
jgi:hypothetical protein